MKKIYIQVILILVACINLNAQWVLQTPIIVAENRSIHMTSTDVGYIAGSSGVILKTTDAGAIWDTLSSGTLDTLRSVFFINDSVGFVSGANGTIRKTTDAGLTWTAQTSGVPNLLRSLFFVSDSVGFVCGGGGVILRTVDGGNTWTPQTSGTTQDLINIRFIDPDKGYCVSSLGTFLSGIILKTIDGGNTWTTVYTDANGLLGLAVVGDSIVYAAGGYLTIVKSTDAGATWTQLNTSPYAAHFRGAAFISPDTGFVVGDSNKIYYTTDGGANWLDQGGLTVYGTLSVFIVNSDTSYACGGNGTIYRYIRPCMPGGPAAINGNISACAGSTETYYINTVPQATSYTWQVPVGSTILSGQGDTLITLQFGTATGNFNISVAAVNSCGQGPQENVTVTIKIAPSVPVITQVSGVLHSSSLVGNQWYYNGVAIPGAINDNWTPLLNGTYTLVVTFTNGCVSDTSAPFIVVNAGIVEQNNIISDLSIIPNPADQNTLITLHLSVPGIVSITAYDALGNEVYKLNEGSIKQGLYNANMSCSGFAKGVYVLKVEVEGKSIFRKFVKE